MSNQSQQFSSEGFDLDAISNPNNADGTGNDGQDVIYEIGGGVTTIPKEKTPADSTTTSDENSNSNKEGGDSSSSSSLPPPTPSDIAEEWKQKGNDEFKRRNFLDAYDMYTKAIETCPCPIKADEILQQKQEFDQSEQDRLIEERQREEETFRQTRSRRTNNNSKDASNKDSDTNNKNDSDEKTTTTQDDDVIADDKNKKENPNKKKGPEPFVLPSQPYGDKLAVYYNNRAATLMHLERYDNCVLDCDVAILLHPTYVKAYVRRSAAFEKTERTEEALRDIKHAYQLDPTNVSIRKSVTRLQKIEDQRLEKLKEETMSKLKDLGNSLLGNFGLSLDNFNAVQDPNTGSYSISFNQNASS